MGRNSKTSILVLLVCVFFLAAGFAHATSAPAAAPATPEVPAANNSPEASTPTYRKKLQEELIYRVNFGRSDDIQILLNRGADPNALNEEGWPALAIAANRSDPEGARIAQTLIAAGADVNLADKGGNYPVMNAVHNGNLDLVKFLMSKGADITVKDATGRTVQDVARGTGNRDVAAFIQNEIDLARKRNEALSSPDNFVKLARGYAFLACKYQYLSYYLASGQDTTKNDDTESKIASTRKEMETTMKQIYTIFPYTPQDNVSNLAKVTMKDIHEQLDRLISNRNRKNHNVGSEEDLKKRCSASSAALNVDSRFVKIPVTTHKP